ncbi:YihY family inner membrane protein [Legionella yabuuchiae]|uniref:YihY family inner membrane protein n=1 Tax=Legionella yabuuchiae TaxID=376727 RepID=UPI001054A4D4|nr:YihY family inner membrane protein [Legionella yabuuchiae]
MNNRDLIHYLKRKFFEAKHFVVFVVNHFIEDDCTYRASALTFTSLLAVVPLMSVSFSILSMFPVFDNLREPIQDFIFENFVPATGKAIQEYLLIFTKQVSKLSMIGVVFLIISALLVMYTIERSMNKIWRVSSARRGSSAFLLYWGILSLGPFLLGLSVAASSYIFSMPFTRQYHAPIVLIVLLPSILSLIGFTFLYVVVPNCRVQVMHGFSGALVATLLFESAKKGFAYYLSQYNTYELLYGAFAIIPIFFVWVYWVWLITLIGAEISYALAVNYERRKGTPVDGFSQALLWLHQLWLAQREGKSVTLDALINTSKHPFAVDVGDMVAKFIELKLIKTTEDGNYILSRDLDHLTLYELIQLLPYRLPNTEEIVKRDSLLEKHWHHLIAGADKDLKQNLDISLNQLFKKSLVVNE